MARTPQWQILLDTDSSESPVYGEQEGAADTGHFDGDPYLFVRPGDDGVDRGSGLPYASFNGLPTLPQGKGGNL